MVWSVKVFNSWVEERNSAFSEKVPTDLLEGKDLSSLGNWLGRFVIEVRQQDGNTTHQNHCNFYSLGYSAISIQHLALRWTSCVTMNSMIWERYSTPITGNCIRRVLAVPVKALNFSPEKMKKSCGGQECWTLILPKGCLTVCFSLMGRTSVCVVGKNIVNWRSAN